MYKHSPKLQQYRRRTIKLFSVISRTLDGEAEMQSVYSAVAADWGTGHTLGKSYPTAEMQSVYSAVLADWVTFKTYIFGYQHILGNSN